MTDSKTLASLASVKNEVSHSPPIESFKIRLKALARRVNTEGTLKQLSFKEQLADESTGDLLAKEAGLIMPPQP